MSKSSFENEELVAAQMTGLDSERIHQVKFQVREMIHENDKKVQFLVIMDDILWKNDDPEKIRERAFAAARLLLKYCHAGKNEIINYQVQIRQLYDLMLALGEHLPELSASRPKIETVVGAALDRIQQHPLTRISRPAS